MSRPLTVKCPHCSRLDLWTGPWKNDKHAESCKNFDATVTGRGIKAE